MVGELNNTRIHLNNENIGEAPIPPSLSPRFSVCMYL